MPAWLFVFGGIVLLVFLLLAVDLFTAGHAKSRLVRAKDQHSSTTPMFASIAVIEQQGKSIERQNPFDLEALASSTSAQRRSEACECVSGDARRSRTGPEGRRNSRRAETPDRVNRC